jgi:hypothetical protein
MLMESKITLQVASKLFGDASSKVVDPDAIKAIFLDVLVNATFMCQ